jgi:hypothetical protein
MNALLIAPPVPAYPPAGSLLTAIEIPIPHEQSDIVGQVGYGPRYAGSNDALPVTPCVEVAVSPHA